MTGQTTNLSKGPGAVHLLKAGMVGAGGVEPPSSSVSAKHREPLC
jgi:hypothetical protein